MIFQLFPALLRQDSAAVSDTSASAETGGTLSAVFRLLDLTGQELFQLGLRLLVIWGLVWAANQLVKLVARRIIKAVDDGDDANLSAREKRGQTAAQLIRSVGRVVSIIFGVVASLNLFIDIRPLLAGAGILGLAISFGAQSLVKDIISGFFILIEDQFVVGDVIEAGGRSGVVERMTLRMVMLRDLRGVVHMIPNGQIATVSNLTRSWSRAVIDVGVAYEADLDRALVVFRDEAAAFHADGEWGAKMQQPPEVVGVDDLADSSVVIRTLLRTEPGKQWECAREFRRRIKNRLDREGISIPFPQRTVHIRTNTGEGGAL